ncbi:MAG: AAA family ATPase, partial [Kiritimatiellaceae bacterium]|nr:AAA family ATPase [Kiritimatiellaceae bacterium]
MLRTLKIKNLALVDDVQVGFHDGLNVITGETGAGKSLVIGALRLLLGERADKSMIRTGEASCSVHAEFGLSDTAQVDAILEDVGLDSCDGGLLIIRRVITETSNKTLVNDESVTLQVLKRLGAVLVDMHGPYDHQSLLDQNVQLEILDAFGQLDEARAVYTVEFDKYRDIQKQIDALNSDNEEDLERQIEFLDYRVNEIEVANLTVDEEAEVEEEHGIIANSQQLIELANGAVQALTEGEGCAFDGLASAQQLLNQLIKLIPEAQDWHDEIESAVTSVQEVVRSIENAAAGIDGSPERMQWLDDRLTTYQTLKRKYGATVEEVLENGETWKQQLKDLRGRDHCRDALQAEQDLILQSLEKAG